MTVGLFIIGYVLMWPLASGLLVRFDLCVTEEAVPVGLVWPLMPIVGVFLLIFALASGEEIF